MKFFFSNIPSVLLMSLVLLASAHRSSNNLRDVDIQELARQNKITKQILEAFIHKKLGGRDDVRPPSLQDILPVRKHQEERITRESPDEEQRREAQELEDDSLQSVESEQIPSIYSEGRKKYPTPPFETETEPDNYRKPYYYNFIH